MISISVIVHRQAALAQKLLQDLDRFRETRLEVLVTVNVPEPISFSADDFHFPLTLMHNRRRKGFGANHNAASRHARGDFWCIANPDIRLQTNPFPLLMQSMTAHDTAVAAPFIVDGRGCLEDNVRRYPTPAGILAKAVGKKTGNAYAHRTEPFRAEWVAGMFMLFKPDIYRAMGGFDEKYHLYYEDVDLCARLRLAGYTIRVCPAVSVVHDARRESHRNPRYMKWHLQSMIRFFLSRTYRQVRALKSAFGASNENLQ